MVTAPSGEYSVSSVSAATRTDTPLIDVPQSVEVITRKLLQDQDAHTLANALVNVSGVIPTNPQEILFYAPIVRGFPAEVYVDGLPVYGGNQQAADPASLAGVQQIAVLKGPTATLYGGGLGTPLGGIINIESERPNGTLGGYAALRAGSFSTWNPYADLNVPLAPGIAARVAAEYQSNNSWIDLVRADRWSVKPSISFQIDPNTDLLVQGQFNHRSQLEYSGLPIAQALSGQIDRDAFVGAPVGQPHTTVDNQMGTVMLRHAFNDDVKLAVTGRYYNSATPEYGSFVFPQLAAPNPATPTAYPIFTLNMDTTTKEGTFDANLQGKADTLGGRHEWLAGLDYDHTIFDSAMGFAGVPVGTLDLANPVYNLPYGSPIPLQLGNPLVLPQDDRYATYAAYVQDQATYGSLHVTGAVRYTVLDFLETGVVASNSTFHHVSPRLGATYDLAPGVAAYAGYATAFRGAFEYFGVAAPKPETSRNVEGGLKLALPTAGLSGTIAYFEQTHDNVITADPNHPGLSIQIGRQQARGVEADFAWEPTPAFALIANYAHTDAKVTQDDNTPSTVGQTLQRVPRSSGRIAVRYRLLQGPAKGLAFGAGVTAMSARQVTLPNTTTVAYGSGTEIISGTVPGNALVDAQASYDVSRRFQIGLSIVNLGGSRAFDAYEYFGFPVVMPTQPRSVFVTLKAIL